MTVTIRPATLSDEKAVLDLIEELFAPPGARPKLYTREGGGERFGASIAGPDGDVLLAEEDGVAVGLASVYVDIESIRFGRRCWLEDLVVTSTRRSGGVGRALLEAATAWARERGCTHLELNSGNGRKDAHRFYLSNGMTQDSLNFDLQIAYA
jgi:GNAT superfamily N-acetyltransferase